MKNPFFLKTHKKIKSVLEDHRRYFTPGLLIFTFASLVTVFAFICFSVYLHPDGKQIYYHFVNEEGAITALSSTLLSMSAILAYSCCFIKSGVNKRTKIFFLIVALAFTYMAMDEILNFHEHMGEFLDTFGNMRNINHKVHIRAWNDTIIIIYGIMAIPVMIYFLPTAVKIPGIPEYFLVSFICYLAHTSIDAFVDPPTTFSYIVEESSKVYTSTFLILGLTSALIFLIQTKHTST